MNGTLRGGKTPQKLLEKVLGEACLPFLAEATECQVERELRDLSEAVGWSCWRRVSHKSCSGPS